MNIHSLEHVWFEDLANIGPWAQSRGHTVRKTLLFEKAALPSMSDFDWLVIMGGPMNIYEEIRYPWLVEEKRFIREAILGGKCVLGICLGAQLIADVLGAKVRKNDHQEIGWHPVTLTERAAQSSVFRTLPKGFDAFHWHGDTFDLPPGCAPMATSEGCVNQAFVCHHRVIGLQFHLESSRKSIERLIDNCAGDFTNGQYVQPRDHILSNLDKVRDLDTLLYPFLDQMAKC